MKAIVLSGEPGKAVFVTDRPYPKPRSGYITVDVKAVALNPADWKHIDYSFLNTKGCLSGCDYAGVVREIGGGYSKSWTVGDRICGFVHGGNQYQPEDGAFAERIMVKADIQIRIPDSMSFEEAAALGVGVVTCGQGLFQQMGLNLPSQPDTARDTVLIYGGSSATGTLGIQFAKLAGYKPITTCSPSNFKDVESLGAVAAFDYKDPNVVEQIKQHTSNLKYVWDTISLASSVRICAEVIAPGGRYGSIIKVQFPRNDVKYTSSLGYTAMGEPVTKGPNNFPDTSDDFDFCKQWIAQAEALLHEGRFRVHPVQVERGLDNVFQGVDRLRHNKVSGAKLVYVL